MPDKDFLHRHPEFEALIRIVADQLGIDPYLAETGAFEAHRKKRFPKVDYEMALSENQAFLLSGPDDFEALKKEYVDKRALYYRGQADFEKVMTAIRDWVAGR